MRNEYASNFHNRKVQYSVMSSNRPMTNRAPTSYIKDFGKPRRGVFGTSILVNLFVHIF